MFKAGDENMMTFMADADMQAPGMPKQVKPSMLSGNQKGTVSVNTENNPHWHDVLAYTPDGSLIRFNDMDFVPLQSESYIQDHGTGTIKYNKICFQRCCVKSESTLTKKTHLTWRSTDGVHTIGLDHHQAPAYEPVGAGKCAPCYPCCCLCISQTCCKSLFRIGHVDYSKMFMPEKFAVTLDGEEIATLEVTPGFDKGSPEEAPVMQRMTTAKGKDGNSIFVMNDVYTPPNDTKGASHLKCCAWPCCPCLACFKPCCCPMCLPFGGGCRCPRPSCSCGPCTFCCNSCINCACSGCQFCFRCGPCLKCFSCACQSCGLCCTLTKGCLTCACCKCGIKESIEVFSEKARVNLPESRSHKAHRIIYPLPKTQGGSDTYAWAAYTHFENSTKSHRATLTMDPKHVSSGSADTPKEVLASLPVLIDLAIGSTGGHRSKWTFDGRQFMSYFDPEDVVNYFKGGEKLQTVIANYDLKDVCNPTKGDVAPKQMKMEDEHATDSEKRTLMGKPAWSNK